jgi:hypothetical protein
MTSWSTGQRLESCVSVRCVAIVDALNPRRLADARSPAHTRDRPGQAANAKTPAFRHAVDYRPWYLQQERKIPMATDITIEPRQESAEDFAARFAELVAAWKEGTRHRSRIKDFKEHPAFREIVAMGERAVPLILAHLEADRDFLFLALSQITKINPVPKESAGKIDEMISAWLAWGRDKGHGWKNAV